MYSILENEDIFVFKNEPLIEKLKFLNKTLEDLSQFPQIEIDENQIIAQKKSLRNDAPPSKLIANLLQDKRESSFCFIGRTNFHISTTDNIYFLTLPSSKEFSLEVKLNLEYITNDGKLFLHSMNNKETPLHVFGSAAIGEKENKKSVLIIPILIY